METCSTLTWQRACSLVLTERYTHLLKSNYAVGIADVSQEWLQDCCRVRAVFWLVNCVQLTCVHSLLANQSMTIADYCWLSQRPRRNRRKMLIFSEVFTFTMLKNLVSYSFKSHYSKSHNKSTKHDICRLNKQYKVCRQFNIVAKECLLCAKKKIQ